MYFNGLTFAPRDELVAGFLGDQGLVARLDLDVYAILDGDGNGSLRWDYDSSIFEPETVRLWMAAFETCLRCLEDRTSETLDAKPLLAATRRRPRPDGRAGLADTSRPLVSMIKDTMERIPERVAVVTPDAETTFGELQETSRRVSGYLRRNASEGPIGLSFPSNDTASAIATMIGTLDAGRRYVVLEPRDPALRLQRIVADAGVRVVLASGALPWSEEDDADDSGPERPRVVRIDEVGAMDPDDGGSNDPGLLGTCSTPPAARGLRRG